MKLNFINKIYIAITLILVVAIVIKFINYKSSDRYYYFSSVCAPESYPIAIHNAYFILADGDLGHIKDEDVDRFTSKWGEEYYFAESHHRERLPVKLVLQYVSYRDKKFYSDTLNLPEKEIKQIFESALQNKQATKLHSHPTGVKGLTFLVGIANDGNIAVWLRGVFLEKLILKQKLTAKEPKGDETYYEKRLSKAEYIKKRFENLEDSVKLKLDNGFEARANYIDTPTHYIEKNKELWEYQKKNKFID
ncbi:hypothetical protein J2X31_003651 [Flavobacterium arsenatis]|uniref:DUF2931 family protein n=1 Tax=Flavobacterium arsenatis TaxID=1484332 RepID=A0ABU1TUS7_9FLAO|nr:DUF2931 family protein [Flavobacterium arsenatis]MDR6969618.1 hypothetical protein [Flavobacterium arsenatis]